MRQKRTSARASLAVACAVIATVLSGCGLPGPSIATPSPTRPKVIALPTELPDLMSYDDTLPLFEYDREVPFDIVRNGTYRKGAATLVDVSYVGANGDMAPAYLIQPAGEGPFAGVVWMGWTGDFMEIRKEFVEEAFGLAERGVVSLLVGGYFPWYIQPSDKDADRTAVIGQIRELRRAIDFLASQDGVDSSRIGFVGHSMGAMYGADLAAIDDRVKTAVLMTPHATLTDWIFDGYGLDPSTRQEYARSMACFDPMAFVSHSKASLFFEFGSDDQLVPLQTAQLLFDAAAKPKQYGYYGGGHDLDAVATRDRDDWLARELNLPASE